MKRLEQSLNKSVTSICKYLILLSSLLQLLPFTPGAFASEDCWKALVNRSTSERAALDQAISGNDPVDVNWRSKTQAEQAAEWVKVLSRLGDSSSTKLLAFFNEMRSAHVSISSRKQDIQKASESKIQDSLKDYLNASSVIDGWDDWVGFESATLAMAALRLVKSDPQKLAKDQELRRLALEALFKPNEFLNMFGLDLKKTEIKKDHFILAQVGERSAALTAFVANKLVYALLRARAPFLMGKDLEGFSLLIQDPKIATEFKEQLQRFYWANSDQKEVINEFATRIGLDFSVDETPRSRRRGGPGRVT